MHKNFMGYTGGRKICCADNSDMQKAKQTPKLLFDH